MEIEKGVQIMFTVRTSSFYFFWPVWCVGQLTVSLPWMGGNDRLTISSRIFLSHFSRAHKK